jgi:hypothetical protein
MKANKKPIMITPEDIQQLAIDIDEFSQDFDQYGYWGTFADERIDEAKYMESAVRATEKAIISGDTEDIKDFLQDAIAECREIPALWDALNRAEELLFRLNRATDLLNRKEERAIYD